MSAIFSMSMMVDAIFALYLGIRFTAEKHNRRADNAAFIIMCLSSFVWSAGFSFMTVQTDTHMAYICRSFGILGTFLFMISSQVLVGHIAELKKSLHRFFFGFSLVGIFIYLLTIQREQTSYHLTAFGMSYSFTPGPVNIIYNAYFLLVTINTVYVTVYMITKAPYKRIKAFGIRFMLVEFFVMIGTVLDMIFPALGFPAIPGSSITQFWGLLVVWYSLHNMHRSFITSTNMNSYIYDSLDVPVLVFDTNEFVSLANDAAIDFVGITNPESSSKQAQLTIYQCFDKCPQNVFSYKGNSYTFRATCRHNGRNCSIVLSKIADKYGDCIGFIAAITDMTDYLTALEKIDEARREADAANRAKTVFLANMSHEIRTPMNAVIGFSELALKEELSSEAEGHVRNIKSAAYNLLGIINDILDISKIESGKMELTPDNYKPAELIDGVYKLVQVQAEEKGLKLEVNADKNIPSVMYGDSARIREIMINLLNNSVKYTRSGSITLSVKRCEAAAPATDPDSNYVGIEIKISDTGIGIKPAALPNLFDAFSRTDLKKNAGIEGTGLGLAIVKGYIELMGGSIKVESEYGKGSTFTAVIPQKIIDNAPMHLYIENDDSAVVQKHDDNFTLGDKHFEARVLVVDDNAVNRLVISKSMAHYGLTVDLAAGGAEALEKCRTTVYPIVFMDQMMPEMDGIEAMHHLRAEVPGYAKYENRSKIIALTANAIRGVREELMAVGFDDYLEKPMNYKELERVLTAYLVTE